MPQTFHFEVKAGAVTESWSEGLNMYHNPNAKHPINPNLFPSIAHHFLEDGSIKSIIPDFHPYSSITLNVKVGRGGRKELKIDE